MHKDHHDTDRYEDEDDEDGGGEPSEDRETDGDDEDPDYRDGAMLKDEKKEKQEKQAGGGEPGPGSPAEDLSRRVQREVDEKTAELRRQYEAEIRNLRYDLAHKERVLTDIEFKFKAIEEKFERIKKPPLIYAYVLRIEGDDLDEGEVVVVRGGDLLKVSTGSAAKRELTLGQYVWVHPQSYAIVGTSRIRHEGMLAKVYDVQDQKLIISFDDAGEKRLIDLPARYRGQLKPGFTLSVLPPTMEILDILPNFEAKRLFLGERPNLRYADIGGHEEIIERIKDVIVLPFQEPELFASVQLTPPKGILMYGPPGCGKTLLAKAIATENDMTFFNLSVADILSKWVGESERIIKELFKQAKEQAPSIIFFDEIEALFTTRGRQDTSGVHKNIIGQILAEMDGILALRDVFVIGATNRPDMLDPALMRPGRFDEIIEVSRPGRKAATAILKIYLPDSMPVPAAYAKGRSKEKVVAELREFVLDELYGEDKWIEVKVDPEAKEAIKTVKRKDIISGAIIMASMKTAKKEYIKRVRLLPEDQRKKEGITREDLARGVEEECKEHALTEYYVFQKRQAELLKRTGLDDPMVS